MAGFMNKRNNMCAAIVRTGSRIKMRQSGIKTLYICAVTLGPVRFYLASRRHSIHHRAMAPMSVDIVARNFKTRRNGISELST